MFSGDPGVPEKYNSKYFDQFNYPDTILPWQAQKGFCQPWQLNDTIPLQLRTNIGPVNFILRSCDTGLIVDTIQFDQRQEDAAEPGMFIYEVSVPLSGYPEGCYTVELDFGGVITLYSGEQNFAELHEGTLLNEYKHYEAREDIIFETGWLGNVRVPGWMKYEGPKQKATVYEDQILNETALRSQKYRVWSLKIGGTPFAGIPDYFADMIGGIIGCSYLYIDGKPFTVNEGSQMEPVELEGYPMRGWGVEMRDRYTRAAITYENDDPIEGVLAVMVNVDSKGFGNSASGSQTVVLDVQ